MSRCLLIINPSSGGGRAKPHIVKTEWELENLFDHLEIRFTHKADDAMHYAEAAVHDGIDAIFCMGGDGTINETVCGIARAGGRHVKFGFIPVGTCNDMCRALGIPKSPKKAIKMLKHAKLRRIDIGRCNNRYFCNNIAAGIIPRILEEVTPREKEILGPLAYFLRGGQALFSTKDYTFHIKTENEDLHMRSPLVLALLTNVVSGFERFMPTASVDDGYMRIVVFKEYYILNVLRIMPLIISGSIYNSDFVRIIKCRKADISIEEKAVLPTNMDGNEGPELPVSLEVLPQYLQVYVPNRDANKDKNQNQKTALEK